MKSSEVSETDRLSPQSVPGTCAMLCWHPSAIPCLESRGVGQGRTAARREREREGVQRTRERASTGVDVEVPKSSEFEMKRSISILIVRTGLVTKKRQRHLNFGALYPSQKYFGTQLQIRATASNAWTDCRINIACPSVLVSSFLT